MINLISILIGGGILAFLQFLITRHDNRKDKNSEVLTAIKRLDVKITDLDGKVDCVDRKVDKKSAVSARVRILRFADEMYESRKHTKDAWDQVMLDCDDYEKFCQFCEKEGIDFSNNITVETIKYLKEEYRERLIKKDFLVPPRKGESA
jgi:hypothetical protein